MRIELLLFIEYQNSQIYQTIHSTSMKLIPKIIIKIMRVMNRLKKIIKKIKF
jgi:hypothetical protein